MLRLSTIGNAMLRLSTIGNAIPHWIRHTIRLTEDAVDRMGDYMRIGSRLFTISPMDFLRQGGVTLTKAFHDMEKRVATQRTK